MALDTHTAQNPKLRLLAEEVVARALRAGATDAEAVGFESEEFAVNVRLGQVEQLTESGSGALGLRVFFAGNNGQRTASTSTSDLSPDGIDRLISGAVELAKVTGADPFAGLPRTRRVRFERYRQPRALLR